LGREVNDAPEAAAGAGRPPNALQQVRLAAAGRADERERRVLTGAGDDAAGGGIGNLVAWTRVEVVEAGELATGRSRGRLGTGGLVRMRRRLRKCGSLLQFGARRGGGTSEGGR